jgi:apoptosis-inducing factor 3
MSKSVTARVVSKRKPARVEAPSAPRVRVGSEETIAIVGGGVAGFAAAHTLREKGWQGRIAMYSADTHLPYDRTLLTKDYLDGHFGDERLEIAKERLQDLAVDLALDVSVEAIDTHGKTLGLRDGRTISFQKLLLATGSTPKPLKIPGADQSDGHCQLNRRAHQSEQFSCRSQLPHGRNAQMRRSR